MTSGFGSLNGSGNQQVWANLVYVSSDIPNNRTRWRIEVRYYGNGWGSWSGSNWSWSVSGFVSASGTFNISSGEAYDTYTVLYNAYFYKTHNSSGVLAAGNATASINTDHTSVGDGSVTVSSGTPPVLATEPATPGTPTGEAMSVTSAKWTWTAPDDGGSAITKYQVQYTFDEDFTDPDFYEIVDVSASSRSYTLSNLYPGSMAQTFPEGSGFIMRARVRAVNSRGTSGWSGTRTVVGPAPIWVSDGSKWVATVARISDGSAWSDVAGDFTQVSDGSAWHVPGEA